MKEPLLAAVVLVLATLVVGVMNGWCRDRLFDACMRSHAEACEALQ